MARNSLALAIAVIVGVHFVVSAWHGLAHVKIPVELSIAKQIYVIVVILIAPIVGTCFLWSQRWRFLAASVVCLSMLGSLLFGLILHYVLEQGDNVTHVPQHPWRADFVISAALIVWTESVASLLAFIAARRWRGKHDSGAISSAVRYEA